MEIGVVNQPMQPNSAMAHKPTDLPTAKKSDVENVQVKIPAVEETNIKTTDADRKEFIHQTAKNIFKDVYAVSDKSFAIFKDVSGQYVTRVKSLRDGAVTYIPEPKLLKQAELMGIDTSRLHLNA